MSNGIIAILAFLTVIFGAYALFSPKDKNQQTPKKQSSLLTSSLVGNVDKGEEKISGFLKTGVKQLAGFGTGNMTNEKYQEVESFLIKAGNPWKLTVEEYQASKTLLGLLGLITGFIAYFLAGEDLGIPMLAWVVLGAFCGYMYPQSKYNSEFKKRQNELRKALPEAIDLLVITMSSGQNFEPALGIVTPNLEPGVLKDEFQTLTSEINAGRPVDQSLRAFSERASSSGTEDFARAVEQAHKLGSDLTDTLVRQSKRARDDYIAELDSKIAKVGNKVTMALAPTITPAALLCLSAQQIGMITGGIM